MQTVQIYVDCFNSVLTSIYQRFIVLPTQIIKKTQDNTFPHNWETLNNYSSLTRMIVYVKKKKINKNCNFRVQSDTFEYMVWFNIFPRPLL